METLREDILKRIGSDDDLWDEIKDLAARGRLMDRRPAPGDIASFPVPRSPVEPEALDRLREMPREALSPDDLLIEAIIRQHGRPVLEIRHDDFDPSELETETWKARLLLHRDNLRAVILSVGRIELENNPYYAWVGTGWVVAEDVIVTNRHVAETFARMKDGRLVFRQSLLGEMEASLDFREEHLGGGPAEFRIVEVLHIEEDEGPDVAFLRIDWRSNAAGEQREPIPLAAEVAEDQMVAVIGYPAKDSRTRIPEEMDRIFGNIYNVKRLAPGEVMVLFQGRELFTHDCTTVGGNSGSIVCDMATGQAVGLHFGGREEQANYAVSASAVRTRLESVLASGRRTSEPIPVVVEEGAPTVESLQDRRGYDPDFLGQSVPLPSLSPDLRQQVAPVIGRDDGLLDYTHYSVMMHATRRVAIYAVCNIDGQQWRKVPRTRDRWYFDPRMDRVHQAGNELYKSNKLDRGHLVRRLDPAWGGTFEDAKLATEDTFFYTNCAPQHKQLNRDLWLDLEDHILGNTDVQDLKVAVFNGPIFRSSDRTYRGFKIPEDFWKVVAMVREDTHRLSVTAYMLSQLDFMDDLEFAFGPYRTYQVPVMQIERLTGLDFGDLKSYDPLAEREAQAYLVLDNLEDIVV